MMPPPPLKDRCVRVRVPKLPELDPSLQLDDDGVLPTNCGYFLRNNFVWVDQALLRKHGLESLVSRCRLGVTKTRMHRGRLVGSRVVEDFCVSHAQFRLFPKCFPVPLPFPPKLVLGMGAALRKGVRFEGALRTTCRQDRAVKACMDQMLGSPHGGAVLNLPPGTGKTSCAICVGAVLGRRFFWLTHTEQLRDQAVSRLAQFLPMARVHAFTSKSTEANVDACDVAVGLMQSVRNANPRTVRSFGLLVVDEAHHICATQLRKCLHRFNTRYTLGLTATPERKDGLTRLLFWSVGPVAFSVRPDYSHMDARVRVVRYSTPPSQGRGGGVHGDRARNRVLLREVRELLGVGHRVLILTDRRCHAILLRDSLRDEGVATNLQIGGAQRESLEHATRDTVRCVCATYQLVSEGFDLPWLDALVLASPKRDIVQSVGRILRTCPNKLSPRIVDVVDSGGGGSSALSRQRQYSRLGFQ